MRAAAVPYDGGRDDNPRKIFGEKPRATKVAQHLRPWASRGRHQQRKGYTTISHKTNTMALFYRKHISKPICSPLP